MSYDVSLEINTGNKYIQVVDCGNYTWNCSMMLVKATGGKSLNKFSGMFCADVIVELGKAIKEIKNNYEEYSKMNPENGWGDIDSWLRFLDNIVDECKNNTKCKLRVC